MIVIERAKEEDFNNVIKIALCEIYDDSDTHLAREFIKSHLEGKPPHIQCFVAKKNDKVIGFIIWKTEDLYKNKFVLEVDLMAVDEDSQKMGIGKALIQESIDVVKRSLAVKRITVMVVADEDGAKKFYRNIFDSPSETNEPYQNRTRFYIKL